MSGNCALQLFQYPDIIVKLPVMEFCAVSYLNQMSIVNEEIGSNDDSLPLFSI